MTLLLLISTSAVAGASHDAPRVASSLSFQVLEIVSPRAGHVATLAVPGISLRMQMSDRWGLIASAGLSFGIDRVSLGGSATVTPQYRVWSEGPWHASVGPGFTFIRSYSRQETWEGASTLSLGGGLSVGRRGTVAHLGLDASTTPEFDWSVALVPRLGVSAAL
ncbi:MAG: hypothetical protein AAF211_18405 [Myxococcota bacterium]